MHQGKAVIVTIKSVKDFVVCNGDSMSDITAGQGFSENQDVRKDKVGYKAVSGTSESCCNLIKNQKHIILIAQFSGTFQERNIIHPHAASALEQRLYDKAVQPVMIQFKCILKRRDLCRDMNDAFFFIKSEMIIFVISDFHCLESVSVVGMFQSQHQRAFPSLIGVVLECHLKRDFYCDTSRVRKEAVVQVTRKKFLKLIRKFFYRFMGETAEHYMAETVSLFFDGGG